MNTGYPRHGPYPLFCLVLVDVPDPDVLAGTHIIQHEVLKNHREVFSVKGGVHVSDIMAVVLNRSGIGVVEPGKQFYEGALACTVGSGQCNDLTFSDLEGDIIYCRDRVAGVGECQVFGNYCCFEWCGDDFRRVSLNALPQVKELKGISYEKCIFIEARE